MAKAPIFYPSFKVLLNRFERKLAAFYKCPCEENKCYWTGQHLPSFVKHLTTSHPHKKVFRCPYCQQECPDQSQYSSQADQESQKNESEAEGSAAESEAKMPRPVEEFVNHLLTNHSFLSWQCNLCMYRAVAYEYVKIHQAVCHPKEWYQSINFVPNYIDPEGPDFEKMSTVCKIIKTKLPAAGCRTHGIVHLANYSVEIDFNDSLFHCLFCDYQDEDKDLMLVHCVQEHPDYEVIFSQDNSHPEINARIMREKLLRAILNRNQALSIKQEKKSPEKSSPERGPTERKWPNRRTPERTAKDDKYRRQGTSRSSPVARRFHSEDADDEVIEETIPGFDPGFMVHQRHRDRLEMPSVTIKDEPDEDGLEDEVFNDYRDVKPKIEPTENHDEIETVEMEIADQNEETQVYEQRRKIEELNKRKAQEIFENRESDQNKRSRFYSEGSTNEIREKPSNRPLPPAIELMEGSSRGYKNKTRDNQEKYSSRKDSNNNRNRDKSPNRSRFNSYKPSNNQRPTNEENQRRKTEPVRRAEQLEAIETEEQRQEKKEIEERTKRKLKDAPVDAPSFKKKQRFDDAPFGIFKPNEVPRISLTGQPKFNTNKKSALMDKIKESIYLGPLKNQKTDKAKAEETLKKNQEKSQRQGTQQVQKDKPKSFGRIPKLSSSSLTKLSSSSTITKPPSELRDRLNREIEAGPSQVKKTVAKKSTGNSQRLNSNNVNKEKRAENDKSKKLMKRLNLKKLYFSPGVYFKRWTSSEYFCPFCDHCLDSRPSAFRHYASHLNFGYHCKECKSFVSLSIQEMHQHYQERHPLIKDKGYERKDPKEVMSWINFFLDGQQKLAQFEDFIEKDASSSDEDEAASSDVCMNCQMCIKAFNLRYKDDSSLQRLDQKPLMPKGYATIHELEEHIHWHLGWRTRYCLLCFSKHKTCVLPNYRVILAKHLVKKHRHNEENISIAFRKFNPKVFTREQSKMIESYFGTIDLPMNSVFEDCLMQFRRMNTVFHEEELQRKFGVTRTCKVQVLRLPTIKTEKIDEEQRKEEQEEIVIDCDDVVIDLEQEAEEADDECITLD